MNNTALSAMPPVREEFYGLANGRVIRVEMAGELLSQIVVTSEQSEGIDNRAYMKVLNGQADALTRQQYDLRRAALKRQAFSIVQ